MLKSKQKSKGKSKKQSNSETPALSLKERLAQKRQVQESRQKLISAVSFCIFFAVVVGLPLGLIAGLKIGLGIAVAVPSIVLSYLYPRQAFWFFLIYLPFNGTVTYWLGGGSAIFQIAKDAFYFPALLGLILACKRRKQPILIPKPLMPTLGILLALSLMTLFFVNGYQQLLPACANVTNSTTDVACREGMPFIQGILGLKVLLGYVPLIFCAYYMIENKKQLLFLGRLHLVLALVCCALGVMQYWMLQTGRCAGTSNLSGELLFKATLEAKCLVGGSLAFSPSVNVIRLPGTFVSPWHWAWFLIANSAITFAVAFNDTSSFWRLGGLVGMALIFINAAISGQRAALLLIPIVMGILLVLTGQLANLKRFIPIGVGLAGLLVVLVVNNPAIVQERWESAVGRWQASPPLAFIENQFEWAIGKQEGLLGRGLGKGTNSARAFGETSLIETYYPKLLYELGPFGTLAFLALVTHLMVITFKNYRSVRDKSLRSFGSSFWVFILLISYNTYWYPLDTDPVAVYYWFFAGVILKLPEIDRQEQEKLQAAEESQPKNKKKGRSKAKRRRRVAY